MSTGRVSIALATHDGAAYLDAQLDSIAAQSEPPSELVAYDDASSDDTVALLEAFAARSPFPVAILRGEVAVGPTLAFDRALAACSGDVVALADQDDVWYPSKLATLVAAFAADPRRHLLVHDLDYCDAELRPLGQSKLERMRTFGDVEREYVTGMATAVRGAFLRACLPIPDVPGIVHDGWLHWCAETAQAKAIVPTSLAAYRRHERNATKAGPLNAARRLGRIHFYTHYLRATLRGEYPDVQTLLAHAEARLAWLIAARPSLREQRLVDDATLQAASDERRAAVEAARERRATLAVPRLGRPWRVLQRVRAGDYRHLKGWRGVAMDLLAPRREAGPGGPSGTT